MYRYKDIRGFHYDLTKEEATRIIKRERIYKLSDWAVELIDYINNKSKENEVILYRDERPAVLMDYININFVTSIFNEFERKLNDTLFFALEDEYSADMHNRLCDFWEPLMLLKQVLLIFERAEKSTMPIAKRLMEIEKQ